MIILEQHKEKLFFASLNQNIFEISNKYMISLKEGGGGDLACHSYKKKIIIKSQTYPKSILQKKV